MVLRGFAVSRKRFHAKMQRSKEHCDHRIAVIAACNIAFIKRSEDRNVLIIPYLPERLPNYQLQIPNYHLRQELIHVSDLCEMIDIVLYQSIQHVTEIIFAVVYSFIKKCIVFCLHQLNYFFVRCF